MPADARLGGERGADLARVIARGRVALAALGVGVARAAFEVARDYAKERQAFGAPIAHEAGHRLQARRHGDRDRRRAAAGLGGGVAARPGRGRAARGHARLDQVRRVALDVADGAVQVLGGHGYIREYLPELHLRNARGFASFEALALV